MAVDILSLGFKVDTAQVKNASKDLDSLGKSAKNSGDSLKTMGVSAEKSTSQTSALSGSVKGLVVAYASLASVKALITIADDYTKLTAQLKLATKSQDEFTSAFNNVKKISTASQSGLSETAMLYARISNATREMGANQTTVAAITESVALGLKVSGASAAEASSAMLQLSQAFGSGVLRGEEFNAVNEAAPRLMKALADGMGVPIGQLRNLASEGKITSDILGNALVKSLDDLKKEAEQTRTISGAFVELKNNILLTAGGLDKATGAGYAFAGAIKSISDSGAIKTVFQTIAVLGVNVAYVFKAIGTEIGGFAARIDALLRKDFKSMWAIGAQVNKDLEQQRIEVDKLTESILNPKVNNAPVTEAVVELTKATGALTQAEKERAKEIENHHEATLKSIAILNVENSLLAQNVPLQDAKTIAQLKANDATDEMIVAMLNANSVNEALTKSLKETEDFYSNFDKSIIDATNAYADLVEGLDKAIQAQKDENAVSLRLVKSIDEITIARLEEKKVILDSMGLSTDALEKEIELRKQLLTEVNYSKMLEAEKKANQDKLDEAQKVADELKKINDKTAEDFNRSLTDALFRGFESGKSFAKTFKDSLINSFKTLILRPIVSFIVDSSGVAQVMGAITAGLSGQAVAGSVGAAGGAAGGGMGLGLAGASSSIFDAVTKGFDTANIAFEQSIQKFGTWVTSFGSEGSALTNLGGTISQYSDVISQALPYAGSVMKLLTGDIKGAAFTAVGTAIGTALGGAVGGVIGSFLGSTIGGLFGGGAKTYRSQVTSQSTNGQFNADKATGAGSRFLKGADQPLTQLSQAFASTLGNLFKSAGLSTDMNLTAQLGQKKKSWGSFGATIGGETYKTSTGANKAGLDKNLQSLVGKAFSDVMIAAIKGSTLAEGIKNLFNGLTDKDQIIQMTSAAANLNTAESALIKNLGLTAGQAADVAIASTNSTESLIQFTNALASIGLAGQTVGDKIIGIKANLLSAFSEITGAGTLPNDLAAFDSLLKGIDKSTQAGISLFSELFALRGNFVDFTNAIDELKSGVSNALFSLMTPAEQASSMLAELGTTFSALNLTVPTSVDQLKALAGAINYTSSAGLTLAAAMPKLVSVFMAAEQAAQQVVSDAKANTANAKQALIEAYNAQKAPIQDTISKFKAFGDSIKAFRLSLSDRAGAVSNPLGVARSRFEQISAQALTGNEQALNSIESASNDYLSVFETYSGSFLEYTRAFAEVSNTLSSVENSTYSTANRAQTQLDALNQQVSILGSIDGGIIDLASAISGYQSAMSAELAAIGALNSARASTSAAQDAAAQAASVIQAPVTPKISIAGMKSGDLVKLITKEGGGISAWSAAMADIKAGGDKVTLASVQDYIRTNLGDKYFANGGAFTNGIVSKPTSFNMGMMGEAGSEAIMPLTNVGGRLGVSTNNSEMVAQLKVISEKISNLEAAQIATAQNTGKTSKILERITPDGNSLSTVAA